MAQAQTQRELWTALLDDFTRRFAGRSARLEVVGRDGTQHVIADGVSFDGISADLHDHENAVTIILLPADATALNHIVADVRDVTVDALNDQAARIEIKSGDDTTTVLSLH